MIRERIAGALALRPRGERSISWLARATGLSYIRLYRLMTGVYDDWRASDIDVIAAVLGLRTCDLWPSLAGAA